MCNSIILSIVIPTKNRADLLRKTLDSIEKQPADQNIFEVIIIDNGSIDRTKEIAGEYKRKIKNCRYFYDARPGLHVGRNKGLLESRGELIAYLDDDVILFPNWINTVMNAFEDEEVVYVGGSVIPYDMTLITRDFKRKYEIRKGTYRFIYCISCFWESGINISDMRVHKMPEGSFFGGNSVYRKKLLYACRGFHPDGMPDNLLMYRGDGETYVKRFILSHKMKAVYYAQASVYHMIDVNRVSDSYIKYMHFRCGISDMYTCLRDKGIKGGLIQIQHIMVNVIHTKKFTGQAEGGVYLLLYYLFYKRVRNWVHRKDYFYIKV